MAVLRGHLKAYVGADDTALVFTGPHGRTAATRQLRVRPAAVPGYSRVTVEALHDAPGGRDVPPIAAATLPREARVLAAADLAGMGRRVSQPVLLLLGTASPPRASEITRELATALPAAQVTELPGAGYEALETAPDLFVAEVLRFLGDVASCT